LRLARLSKSRGSLTVVLSIICPDISAICQYVKKDIRAYGFEDGGKATKWQREISPFVAALSPCAPKKKTGPDRGPVSSPAWGRQRSPSRGELLPALWLPSGRMGQPTRLAAPRLCEAHARHTTRGFTCQPCEKCAPYQLNLRGVYAYNLRPHVAAVREIASRARNN
jgi:hypothetical protein